MGFSASPETLSAIWQALNAPPPKTLSSVSQFWSGVARDGWVGEGVLEDNLLVIDHRIDRQGLKLRTFTELLGAPWRVAFPTPKNRFDEPYGLPSLSAVDAAALLILLERLGFGGEPEHLCAQLHPTLRNESYLTGQGLDVLFHDKSQHRLPPLMLATEGTGWRGSKKSKARWVNGYRGELTVGGDGAPLLLRRSVFPQRTTP